MGKGRRTSSSGGGKLNTNNNDTTSNSNTTTPLVFHQPKSAPSTPTTATQQQQLLLQQQQLADYRWAVFQDWLESRRGIVTLLTLSIVLGTLLGFAMRIMGIMGHDHQMAWAYRFRTTSSYQIMTGTIIIDGIY